jgi:hypothetical protein
MSARTYSTDIYLTCPCPECEGRKVRITLRRSSWARHRAASTRRMATVSDRKPSSAKAASE